MSIAKANFDKFKNETFPHIKDHMNSLALGQSPQVLMITCSDSRVMPTDITNSKAGDLFVIRNAGNLVPKYKRGIATSESLTIEYAVNVLKVKEIVVCGHASCGAMDGILKLGQLTGLECVHSHLEKCSHDFDQSKLSQLRNNDNGQEALAELISDNVSLQIKHLLSYPFIAEKIKTNDLNIFGWVYDFANGELTKTISHKEIL